MWWLSAMLAEHFEIGLAPILVLVIVGWWGGGAGGASRPGGLYPAPDEAEPVTAIGLALLLDPVTDFAI
jgi:hypothetical protein